MNLIENLDEKNIVHALLEGAFLASFIFHTHFQLIFDCQRDKEFKDKKLPREITLSILSDWWFGDKEEWDRTVKRMTEGRDYVEPEEPVLAFKLAALRWSGGTYIDSVNISPEKTELIFSGGEHITILNHDTEDCAWEIYATNYKDHNNCWSVLCDGDGELSYDIPT